MTSERFPRPTERHPGWFTRDIARAAIVILLVAVTGFVIFRAHNLIFVAYIGALLGIAISAGAAKLRRFGIGQGFGAALIVAASVALLIGFGAWTGPTVRTQYRELKQRLPEAFVKLDRWIGQRQGGVVGSLLTGEPDSTQIAPLSQQQRDSIRLNEPQGGDSLVHLRALKEQILARSPGASGYVLPVLHSTVEVAASIVIIFFLAVYIGADPKLYRGGIMALIPHSKRVRGEQVLEAITLALRRWLVTQLIAMLVMGVVATAVLTVLQVRAAVPLGILSGLLQFVPMAGPIISAVPAIAMGFVDSPEKAAAVLVAFYIIHFLESHLLIPLLMKEGVNLPPVLTVLTQAGMALAFGVMGLFVAVPLLVLVMILVKMLYVEDVIGDPTPLPFVAEPPPHPDE
ncbi:MAG TPA: AI-2E family transporter [Gemmatimonadaceae bacterium]|nr:AI-2E family transporter [Gemmatimonadaceae bacterium]